jgi:predicted nucleic-acid-binding protein
MKRYIIDTNGYLRLLLNDIPEQADKVEELLTQVKNGKVLIFLPQIVVFEIVFILEKYYCLSKDEVLNKVESLVSVGYVEVESKEIFLESISLYRDNNISFVDCFLFVLANQRHADIFTFDKKLEKMS